MKKLDIVHHKFIMVVLILIVLLVGVYFGAMFLGVSGTEGMLVLLFSLTFVNSVVLYMLTTQVLHLQHGRKRK